ncbi:MAG: M48 metallopeptidase family protein [Candidatus Binatia bacterium]
MATGRHGRSLPDGTDYVIAHELAHLLEPNHGPELWRILDRSLPDWRDRCEELKVKARHIYWCHQRMVHS